MKRLLIMVAIMFAFGVGLESVGINSAMWIAGAMAGAQFAARSIDEAMLVNGDAALLGRRGNQLVGAAVVGALGLAGIYLIADLGINDGPQALFSKFVASLMCGAAIELLFHRDPRPTYSQWSAANRNPAHGD